MDGNPDMPPAKDKPAEAPEKEPVKKIPNLDDAFVEWTRSRLAKPNPLIEFADEFKALDPTEYLHSHMSVEQQRTCRKLMDAYILWRPKVLPLIEDVLQKDDEQLRKDEIYTKKIKPLSDELDDLLPDLIAFRNDTRKTKAKDIPRYGDERDTLWARDARVKLAPELISRPFLLFQKALNGKSHPKENEIFTTLSDLKLLGILELQVPPGSEKDPYMQGMRMMLYKKRDVVQGAFDALSLDDPAYVEKFLQICADVRTRLIEFRKLEAAYAAACIDYKDKPAEHGQRVEKQQSQAWHVIFPKAPPGQEEAWKGMETGWRQLREFMSVPLPEPSPNHPGEDRQELIRLHKDHMENALPKLRAVIAYCSLYAANPKDFSDADRAEMSGIMTEELSKIESYLARIYPHAPPDKQPTIAKFLAELPTILICGAAMGGPEGSHTFHRNITLYDHPLFKALDKSAGVHRAVTVYTKHGSSIRLDGLQQYNTMAPHLQKQILQQIIDQVKGTNCVVILDGYAEASKIFAELQKALPKGQVLINCPEVLESIAPELRPFVQKGMAEAQSALLEKGMKPEQIASLLKNLKIERSIFMETMSHLKNMGVNGGVAMMAILDIGSSPNKVDAAMKFGVMLGAIGIADAVIMDALLTKFIRAKLTGDAAKKAILRMNGMNPMLKMGIILGGCFLGHEWMENHMLKPLTEGLADSSFRRTTEQVLNYATFGSAWNELKLGQYRLGGKNQADFLKGGENKLTFIEKFHARSIDPRSDWVSILGMTDNDGNYKQNPWGDKESMVDFWNARVREATDDKSKPKFVSKETAAAWKIVGTIDKQWANVRGAEVLTYSQEMAASMYTLKKLHKELKPDAALASKITEGDFDAAMKKVLQTSLNDPAAAVEKLRNDEVVSEGFPHPKSVEFSQGVDHFKWKDALSIVNRDWKVGLVQTAVDAANGGAKKMQKTGGESGRSEETVMIEMKQEMERFRGMASHTSHMTSMLSAHNLPGGEQKIYDYNRFFPADQRKAERMECLMDKFAQDLLLRATSPSLEVSSKIIKAAPATGQAAPGVGTLIEDER